MAAPLGAALLALVHVVTPLLRFLDGSPRSVWLSLAGGVSVAYVFVHFLPELAIGEREVGRAAGGVAFAERHVYLIALAGLLAFYGLDRLAKASRSRREGAPVGGRASGGLPCTSAPRAQFQATHNHWRLDRRQSSARFVIERCLEAWGTPGALASWPAFPLRRGGVILERKRRLTGRARRERTAYGWRSGQTDARAHPASP